MKRPKIDSLFKTLDMTTTTNGAYAHKTTLSANLDLFGSNVRIIEKTKERNEDMEEKIKTVLLMFKEALKEDEELAMQNFFNIIDVRGGKGEKRVTTYLILYLNEYHPNLLIKHLKNIVHFSRWDRLLNNYSLFNDEVKKAIITLVINNVSDPLMFKWLPSINASNEFTITNAKAIAKDMNLFPNEYRKWVVNGRKVLNLIETALSTKNYNEIEVAKIPKLALKKYNDKLWDVVKEKMEVFSKSLKEGTLKLNVDTLTPFDMYNNLMSGNIDTVDLYDSLWNQMKKMNLDALPVIDVSGSMSGNPEKVARSLGVYVAEQNKGVFRDKVFIFSDDTKVLDLSKYEKASEKLEVIDEYSDVASTNLESVFDKLLELMEDKENHIPKNILLISDMQFNMAVNDWDDVIYKKYQQKFKDLKLPFPNIIFWNVNSPLNQFPITRDDIGVCMMYGDSIHNLKTLEMLKNNEDITLVPIMIMMETLEKYKEFLK